MTRTSTTKKAASPTPVRYRVAEGWPWLQVNSRRPGVSRSHYEDTERAFRAGDVLPDWMSATETQHLLGLGAIEVVR